MNIISTLRDLFRTKNPEAIVRARLTDSELIITEQDGTVHRMLISQMKKIAIETTDTGPFVEDVYWAISDGSTTLRVPQACPDFQQLLDGFGKFTGFNDESFVRAMTCAENQEFVCWTK